MKISHKGMLKGATVAFVLLVIGAFCLHSRAPDFWGYGRAVSDGRENSAVFFVEVRGVGDLPTIAYIVRCPEPASAPKNMLDVSRGILPQIEKRTRVMDRWRSECMLLVGRRVGERILIRLDTATARKWFGRPGAAFVDLAHCQEFWNEFIDPRIVEFEKRHPGAE